MHPNDRAVQIHGSLRLIAALSLFLIGYTTLFPFDFRFGLERTDCSSVRAAMCAFDLQLLRPDARTDWPRNIVLFMPWGFAVAGLLLQRGISRLPATLLATAIGLLTSTVVEFLQLSLAYRAASLADIIANTVGTALGAMSYAAFGQALLQHAAALSERLIRRVAWWHLLAAGAIYALLLAFFFGSYSRTAATLDNWDSSFFLTLGNEVGGERAWLGEIQHLEIADRGVSAREASCLLDDACTTDIFGEHLVAAYAFDARQRTDTSPNQPTLIWQDTGLRPDSEQPARFTEEAWLQSAEPAAALIERLSAASEFSLVLALQSASERQFGPARVVSLSNGPFQRNLTVGQQGADLIVRLRTPFSNLNGTQPEFVMADVFADTTPHRLVLSFQDRTLRLYVDNVDRVFQISLPAAMLFHYLRPVDTQQMRANSRNLTLFNWLLGGLVLAPFGLLLLTARAKHRLNRDYADDFSIFKRHPGR